MTESPPPRRVRVVSPRSRARAGVRRAVRHDIDEQTNVGEVYMRSLVRAQLRLALSVCLAVLLLLGGLPLLLAREPRLSTIHLFGVPLPWLLLGVLVHPVLIVGGWVYMRLAERNERVFAELVERS